MLFNIKISVFQSNYILQEQEHLVLVYIKIVAIFLSCYFNKFTSRFNVQMQTYLL